MTELLRLGVAVDTSVLVYAEGEGDAERCMAARDVLARLPTGDVVLPSQVLAERRPSSDGPRAAQCPRGARCGARVG